MAEFVGTFALVFCGTGAIVINDVSRGAVTHVGIALTFGLVVLALIYALGHISGCHLNPAVTIGLWLSRKCSPSRVGPYILVQCLGAIAASGVLSGLFPTHPTLGATHPAGSSSQSFLLETILTWFLMWVILTASTRATEQAVFTGVAVGAVIGLEAMFAGPISGASMNPARSLGPAVVSGKWEVVWLYLTAPVLGAVLGVLTFWAIHEERAS